MNEIKLFSIFFIVVDFITVIKTLWSIFNVTLSIPLVINTHIDVAITVTINLLILLFMLL